MQVPFGASPDLSDHTSLALLWSLEFLKDDPKNLARLRRTSRYFYKLVDKAIRSDLPDPVPERAQGMVERACRSLSYNVNAFQWLLEATGYLIPTAEGERFSCWIKGALLATNVSPPNSAFWHSRPTWFPYLHQPIGSPDGLFVLLEHDGPRQTPQNCTAKLFDSSGKIVSMHVVNPVQPLTLDKARGASPISELKGLAVSQEKRLIPFPPSDHPKEKWLPPSRLPDGGVVAGTAEGRLQFYSSSLLFLSKHTLSHKKILSYQALPHGSIALFYEAKAGPALTFYEPSSQTYWPYPYSIPQQWTDLFIANPLPDSYGILEGDKIRLWDAGNEEAKKELNLPPKTNALCFHSSGKLFGGQANQLMALSTQQVIYQYVNGTQLHDIIELGTGNLACALSYSLSSDGRVAILSPSGVWLRHFDISMASDRLLLTQFQTMVMYSWSQQKTHIWYLGQTGRNTTQQLLSSLNHNHFNNRFVTTIDRRDARIERNRQNRADYIGCKGVP